MMIATGVTCGIFGPLILLSTIAIWIWLWDLRPRRIRIWVRRIIFGALAVAFNTYAAYGVIFIIWRPKLPEYRLSVTDCAFFLLLVSLGLLFSWRFAVWCKTSIST